MVVRKLDGRMETMEGRIGKMETMLGDVLRTLKGAKGEVGGVKTSLDSYRTPQESARAPLAFSSLAMPKAAGKPAATVDSAAGEEMGAIPEEKAGKEEGKEEKE